MSVLVLLHFLVAFALAIGWLVAGAVFVRRAHATAGYLMIGAGGLALVMTCCQRALRVLGAESYGSDSMLPMITVVISMLSWLVEWTLVAVSLSMLAKELKARKDPGPRVF